MQILGSYSSTSPSFLFILCLITTIIGIGLAIYFMVVDNELAAGITAAITLFSFVFLFLVPMEIPNGKTSYVVEMNESINYNEFYEKYEVIDHYEYTNIYVIEEK